MSENGEKSAVYDQLARIGKSLASGPRLEILDLLCQGPRSVDALAQQVGQSVANTSRHLQILSRARLVEAERQGVRKVYRVADPDVAVFFHALRELAESRLHEIERIMRAFRESRHDMEPVACDHLIERVRAGEVTVLDVRPSLEYEAGHLPGAMSVPLGELEQRLAELPRDRAVVAYCRGPYCVMAADAVKLLRARGFEADHLDAGVTDWRARGFDVETASEATS